MVKKDMPLRGSLRNEAREMTACQTHPDFPSLMLPIPSVVEVNGADLDSQCRGGKWS